MELAYINEINVEDYNKFRDLVGWDALEVEEAQAGIDNSSFVISCKDGIRTVGIARMIWDRGYIAFLSDVIVYPDYRGMGIGKEMVTRLLNDMKEQLKPGWKVKVNLMSAPGKEPFYQKIGLSERPNKYSGAGMDMWLQM
jgi:GNAT superfamily N-acetyltransferase